MKSWFALAFISATGVFFGMTGCAAPVDSGDEAVGTAEEAISENACQLKCRGCTPQTLPYCSQVCELHGNCGTRCQIVAKCLEGYHWDETACNCLPDGGGQPCGTSTCGAGQYCCNESCGICAPIGGGCIELYCGDGETISL